MACIGTILPYTETQLFTHPQLQTGNMNIHVQYACLTYSIFSKLYQLQQTTMYDAIWIISIFIMWYYLSEAARIA